ncbi:DUF6750 family protein [Pseudomonas luteola]
MSTGLETIDAFSSLVIAIALLIGVVMFVSSVYGFKQNASNPQQFPISKCITGLLVGCGMLALPFLYVSSAQTLGVTSTSSWEGGRSVLSASNATANISSSTGSQNFLGKYLSDETKKLIIGFVFLIGLIAFVRGIYLFKDMGNRQGNGSSTTAMSLFHVGGGVVCMNILYFSCLFAATFNIPHICST